jgi:hypothetical protein
MERAGNESGGAPPTEPAPASIWDDAPGVPVAATSAPQRDALEEVEMLRKIETLTDEEVSALLLSNFGDLLT